MTILQPRGPSLPVLHFYWMKLAGNLVRITITTGRTTCLQPFPDYTNRPARQRPVMKPAWPVSAGTRPGLAEGRWGGALGPRSKFPDVRREQLKNSSSHLLGSGLIPQESAVMLTLGKRV